MPHDRRREVDQPAHQKQPDAQPQPAQRDLERALAPLEFGDHRLDVERLAHRHNHTSTMQGSSLPCRGVHTSPGGTIARSASRSSANHAMASATTVLLPSSLTHCARSTHWPGASFGFWYSTHMVK